MLAIALFLGNALLFLNFMPMCSSGAAPQYGSNKANHRPF
jgi:hypothetical protein